MRPFLADFGLAKDTSTGSRYTRTGRAIGTPAYMAPEQARGEVSGLAPAADVWSLGCVLYELLAGRPPFGGESTAEVIAGILAREPARLHAVRADLPAGLDRVARVCLAKRGRDRYPSAAGLRDDLDRLLHGASPLARPPQSSASRRVALATAAAVAGASLLALAGGGGGAAGGSAPAAEAEALAARAAGLRYTDPASAITLLSEALRREPNRSAWRLQRATLHWVRGELGPAGDDWRSVAEGGGADAPVACLHVGLATMFTLDPETGRLRDLEARPWLAAAARATDRVGPLAQAALAVAHARWTDAAASLRGLPGWEAALLRAHLAFQAPHGRPEDALREYDLALGEGPPLAWAFNNRASVRDETGDSAGALADFDEALRLWPDYFDARLNRASCHATRGDAAAAEVDLARADALRPFHPRVRLARAHTAHRRGDLAEAIAAYGAVLAAAPDLKGVRRERGSALVEWGEPERGLADLEQALVEDPSDPVARFSRGLAHDHLGHFAEALADLDVAIQARADWPEALSNRGNIRRKVGRMADARADLEAAVALRPAYGSAWGNLALVREALHDLAGGAEAMRRFLALAPDDRQAAQAKRWLADVEAELAAGG